MVTINTAVDTGFSYALGISKVAEVCIPNYIEEISETEMETKFRSDIKKVDIDHILIEYQGRYFVVGDFCAKKKPFTKHLLARANRIKDIKHEIELISVLGFMLPDNNEFKVNLGVGLPNGLKSGLGEYEKHLKKKFTFSYLYKDGSITKNITVAKVVAMPQPLAPIFSLPQEIQNQNILSIDIGHGTLDAHLVNNLMIVEESGMTVDADGMFRVYNQLRDELVTKFSKPPYNKSQFTDLDMQKIIETQSFSMGNEILDVEKELSFVLNMYKQYIIDVVENAYGSVIPDINCFVASGGILNNIKFRDELANYFRKTYNKDFYLSTRPQWNIVRGIFEYVVDVFEDDYEVKKTIKKASVEV